MKRDKLSLVDVLAAALLRSDPGPRFNLWEVAMRPSDVQKQPERKRAASPTVPVILGISGDSREL